MRSPLGRGGGGGRWRRWSVPLFLGLLVVIVAAVASASASATPPTHDASLLQAGAKTYSAASARASLHAGARASASRFHDVAGRVGIDVRPKRTKGGRRHQQDRTFEREQHVMLGIVEKVLGAADKAAGPSRNERDGTHAEAMEDEFHLLNALMEKQSEMREYAHDSKERDDIGGVSRKFLKSVTDKAVKNALRKIRKNHPKARMHSTEPVHLYGVRSPYNGPTPPKRKKRRPALFSEEAMADPYLSRNMHIDPVARGKAFAERTRPQMVYRLGKRDRDLLAEREVDRNQHFHQQRSHKHQARRSKPTPKPRRRGAKTARRTNTGRGARSGRHANPARRVEAKAKAPTQSMRFQAAQPKPQVPISASAKATTAQPKPAASADTKIPAASFLEVETELGTEAFDMHAAYMAELDAHSEANEGRPWFVHHEDGLVDDSHTASAPLHHLFREFAPSHADEIGEGFSMLEVESEVDAHTEAEAESEADAESMPLRELGILLGLNPNKKTPTPEAAAPVTQAAAAAPAPAPASPIVPPAAQAIAKKPALQPRFTQAKAKTRSRQGARARVRDDDADAGDGGAAADPADPAAGSADDVEAMANAGDAYTPSSLKHPPPPPVPPPPPPPPPPKFSTE